MDERLKILGRDALFDVSGGTEIYQGKTSPLSFIYPAKYSGGCTRLFKILQTNKCENDCLYCVNRRSRDCHRFSFSPEELAKVFIRYYNSGLVNGLFLSSAIYENPVYSEENILKTIILLRKKYDYHGYIHAKILPGVEEPLINELSEYSDRLSINLEAPGQDRLSRLSKDKNFARLISGLRKITKARENLKAGITTQLVVGVAGESDREILNLSKRLYSDFNLSRVYYSGFIPVRDTPLDNIKSCPRERKVRLYQADFLLKRYGFSPGEIGFNGNGNLPLGTDPKLVWAKNHRERFPVEINKASLYELLRVPGIGIISAKRIVNLRRDMKIRNLDDLKKTGTVIKRARNFLLINGKYYGNDKIRNPNDE
jgi:predicted DNA-binding helix-hairpin-helix protein